MVRTNSMHYFDNLFNHNAKITLTFTHSSNLLYKINLSWEGLSKIKSKKLEEYLLSTLENKYGSLNNSIGGSLSIQNGKRCDGKATIHTTENNRNKIYLSRADCFNSVRLIYTNLDIQMIHFQESKEANDFANELDAEKL